jgi:polysaccharide pyruvyl transferase WcaK-like protein
MSTIELSEQSACQVNRTLNGDQTALSEVISETRRRRNDGEAVTWKIPVSPRTVHRLEGLYMLSKREEAELELTVTDTLSERQTAFLNDFALHRMGQNWDTGSGLPRKAEFAAELAEEAFFGLRSLPQLMGRVSPLPITSLNSVLIVGAYGGDHIGDAAILGGVLLTLHAKYGVTRAKLLSHRAHHTRRLVAGLKTPVEVSVYHYDSPTGVHLMSEVDALVVAGGPMMDLPRVLAKHLAAAGEARRLGKPFIIERVGLGPFKRESSRKAARVLLGLASRISTRTSTAAQSPIAKGFQVEVGRDPAFDYLATRQDLDLLTDEEVSSIDALLQGTEGRLLVGINNRPIRHDWSAKGESYAKTSEDRFIENTAEAMKQFAKSSSRPVTYVFFSMNSIQFGMSDLTSAYRFQELVGDEVDFRIWEADPDVDGMLCMLRRLDMNLAVRFHACIFSISQGIPTIGGDYYPGGGGKVCELFKDLNMSDEVRVMDEITPEWLVERFQKNAERAKQRA